MLHSFIDKIPFTKSCEYENKTNKLTVIRNFTLEPHFNNTVNYYAPELEIEYCYFENCISQKMTFQNDVFVILHLPFLMGDIYYNFYKLDNEERNCTVEKQINFILAMIEDIINKANDNQVYIALFVSPDLCSVFSGQIGFDTVADQINRKIIQLASTNRHITLINSTAIARKIGLLNYFSTSDSYTTISLITREAINYIVYELISKYNQNKLPVKCIVLDCDNVLWGGIIDENGIDGIVLSNNGIGRAYREFQREILKLKKQGFLICICSKNDVNVVKKVFDLHPYMLIKWDDLCAKKVSFKTKSQSIIELSHELRLPVEEMLFLDDSVYEISEVGNSIKIKTLLLDAKKPHMYIKQLYNSGYVFKDFVSSSDICRTEQYRSTFTNSSTLITEYEMNKMLETQIVIRQAVQSDLQRISELSYRTHQFNMSCIKYDLEDLKKIKNSPNYLLFVLQARDIYGDLGIVSAAILNKMSDKIIIDSFFVSCRVLGRNIENKFIKFIINDVAQKLPIYGYFNETEYNKQFCKFYHQNNITLID